jgi:hypothetical protein
MGGINITRIEALRSERAPVLYWAASEHRLGRAYLCLDRDGDVYVETEHPSTNSFSADVWHGRVLRWGITPNVSGSRLYAFVLDILPIIERVHAGHEIIWDGNHYIGRLTEDAQEAAEDVAVACERLGGDVDVWHVSDWLADYHLPEDASIEQEAREIEADAEGTGVYLVGDVRSYLERLREEEE